MSQPTRSVGYLVPELETLVQLEDTRKYIVLKQLHVLHLHVVCIMRYSISSTVQLLHLGIGIFVTGHVESLISSLSGWSAGVC
jgi:hypothetical protein